MQNKNQYPNWPNWWYLHQPPEPPCTLWSQTWQRYQDCIIDQVSQCWSFPSLYPWWSVFQLAFFEMRFVCSSFLEVSFLGSVKLAFMSRASDEFRISSSGRFVCSSKKYWGWVASTGQFLSEKQKCPPFPPPKACFGSGSPWTCWLNNHIASMKNSLRMQKQLFVSFAFLPEK